MVSLDSLHGLGNFRLAVLDDMTFVQNAVDELLRDSSEIADVVPEYIVGSDQDIELGELLELRAPLLDVTGVHERPEVVCIFLDFVIPVVGQRGRTND